MLKACGFITAEKVSERKHKIQIECLKLKDLSRIQVSWVAETLDINFNMKISWIHTLNVVR